MREFLAVAALVALAGCAKPKSDVAPVACAVAEGGRLTIESAWVRAQSDAAATSAAYFTLCNAGVEPVTIVGMTTPAAGLVELHESKKDANGVISMAPTGPITLSPGEAVVFEPGGKHAMLINLSAPIPEGATTTLTLELAGIDGVSAEAKAVSAVEAAGHAH